MLTKPCVIVVGNFDGVHVAHRALLRAAHDLKAGRVVVLTFTQHPMSVLRPDRAPPVLTDTPQKMAALLDAGADQIEWLTPDPSLLNLTPREFVVRVADKYKPAAWVEGPNFQFGHNREGDVTMLRQFGREMGFAVHVIEPVEAILRDKSVAPVSSSLIRWLVGEGRVADAAICLGRPFTVRGSVVKGDRLGRTIGCPTVNLDTAGRQLPGDGVYAGHAEIAGERYPAAISIGVKPTLGQRQRVFEAHLLGFSGDLYGQTLEISVTRFLRDQAAFPDLQTLKQQIARDVESVRLLNTP